MNSDSGDLFAGLRISQAGETYMQHQGRYPVIFLQMKTAAAGDFEKTFAILKAIIAKLYRKYAFLEESQALTADEKEYYVRVRHGREYCTYDDLILSLGALADMLYKHYGTKPIILIDEYDAPIQHAWENGFYDELIQFMRQFYYNAADNRVSEMYKYPIGCIGKDPGFADTKSGNYAAVYSRDCPKSHWIWWCQ